LTHSNFETVPRTQKKTEVPKFEFPPVWQPVQLSDDDDASPVALSPSRPNSDAVTPASQSDVVMLTSQSASPEAEEAAPPEPEPEPDFGEFPQTFDFVLKRIEANLGPDTFKNGIRPEAGSPEAGSPPEMATATTPADEEFAVTASDPVSGSERTAPFKIESSVRRVLGRGRARRRIRQEK
jgi:hypothetical protein